MEDKNTVGRPKIDSMFPTKTEIDRIRRQDAIRCNNYLTAEDFEKMYGDADEKRLDTTRS